MDEDRSNIYDTKYDYLKYHMYDKYNITESDMIYHFMIPLDETDYSCKNIPECHSCIEDYTNISSKSNKEFKLKCTKSCLWFYWFDNKRQQFAKKQGKRVEYYLKKEFSEITINKELVKKVDFNNYMKLVPLNN